MMKLQFLLTWVVLFGVVGVYSQLQQLGDLKISDEWLYESHERVARGSRQPTQSMSINPVSPRPAHRSSSASWASQNLYTKKQDESRGAIERAGKKAGKAYGEGIWPMYPPSAHDASTAAVGRLNVVQENSRRNKGHEELNATQRNTNNSPRLQQTLKDKQQRVPTPVIKRQY